MFKESSRGFLKFFTTQRIIILVVFLILAYVLFGYSNTKSHTKDGYSDGFAMGEVPSFSTPSIMQQPVMQQPVTQPTNNTSSGGYNTQSTGNPQDLLPKDQNSQFSNFNMVNQGNIVMPDLLDAGYLIGLDTIGQTLRNPNYQERSDPIIPKTNVGPWNNSTIEPDAGRVPLEIGQGPR
jgi:hypothetical protein